MKRIAIFSFLILCMCSLIYIAEQVSSEQFRQVSIATDDIDQLITDNDLKDGDIIFQTSQSSQSKAIQSATHSPYSHCGIIYKSNNEFYVFEAVQPVKQTPINQWVTRGFHNSFVIKRLKNRENLLASEKVSKMKKIAETFIGRNYDPYFNWSDEQMYCSELIWKIYKRGADIEVGILKTLQDFDLTNEIVRKKMAERYGKDIPLRDTIISPDDIFNSDLLETVINTY